MPAVNDPSLAKIAELYQPGSPAKVSLCSTPRACRCGGLHRHEPGADCARARPLGKLIEDFEDAPLNYRIEQVLAFFGILLLVGRPKAGKTFLAQLLGLSIAAGVRFLDFVTMAGRVLYCDEENGSELLVGARFPRMIQADPAFRDPETLARLRVCSFAGVRLSGNGLDVLRREIEAFGAEVLILDSFRRVFGGDENSSEQIAKAIETLSSLRNEFSIEIIVLHHLRKDSGGSDWADSVRGSGDLFGGVDALLGLQRTGKLSGRIRTAGRAAPALDPIDLEFVPETLTWRRAAAPAHEAEQGRKKKTDEDRLFEIIHETPGQSRRALRKAMKIGSNPLGTLLDRLADGGRIEDRGDGWHPVSVTEDGERP